MRNEMGHELGARRLARVDPGRRGGAVHLQGRRLTIRLVAEWRPVITGRSNGEESRFRSRMRTFLGRAGRLRCVDAPGIPGAATRPHPRPEPRSWAEAAFVPSRPLDGPAPAGAPVALAVQEITTLRASVLSRSATPRGGCHRARFGRST